MSEQSPFLDMTPEARSSYAKSTPSFEGSVDWGRVRMGLGSVVDTDRPGVTEKEARKTNIKQALENLSKNKPEDQQKGARQLVTLGQQADNIGIVPQASEYVRNMIQVYGDNALQVFSDEPERFEQFEQETRQLNKRYGKSGYMHIDRNSGVARMILENEVRAMAYEKAKASGASVEWAAPKRWYPEEGTFTYYQDFSFDNDDTLEPDFDLDATGQHSPSVYDTQPVSTVSPDTAPHQVENFTDPGLQVIYDNLPILTPQAMVDVQTSLLNSLRANPNRSDAGEIKRLMALITQRVANATRPQPAQQGGLTVEDIARGVRAGYSGFAKEQKEKSTAYEDFLSVEEWNKGLTPALGESLKTEYWEGLSQIERELLNIRRDLNSLASQKRNAGVVDFETYAKLPEVNSVQTKEVRMLCANLPGFEKALGEYARIFLQPSNPDSQLPGGVGIREIKSEAQATEFRRMVRSRLEEEVRNSRQYQDRRSVFAAKGMSDQEGVRLMAREAEQAAFNLLYGTNAFESWVQPWDESGKLDLRKYKPFINTRFTNPALVESLYPLATAISKGRDGKVHGGKQYDWIATQMARLKKENGGRVEYTAIQVVDTNNKGEAERTYWRIKNGTLMVPEVYLRKVVDSPWERYKAGDQRLVDCLLSGAIINWDSLRAGDNYTDDFTGQYARDAKKAQTISNALVSGVGSSKPGEPTAEENLSKAFEAHPKLKNKSNLRYIYSAIYPYNNIPYAEGSFVVKDSMGPISIMNKTSFFTTKTDIFFPWDGPSKVKKRPEQR